MEKRFDFVMIGPPGAGKGTQRELLQNKYNLETVVTGDLIRELRAKAVDGDQLAMEIKKRYDQGIPQPDDVVIEAVRRKLSSLDLSRGVIFDAFPLSLGQAEGLEDLVKEFSLPEPIAFYVDITENESVERLSKRKLCPQCKRVFYPLSPNYDSNKCDVCGIELITRPDDKPEVVRRRYHQYLERMQALKQFYYEKGSLLRINGEQTVEDVFSEINDRLSDFLMRSK
jgi:adenylate kinase